MSDSISKNKANVYKELEVDPDRLTPSARIRKDLRRDADPEWIERAESAVRTAYEELEDRESQERDYKS